MTNTLKSHGHGRVICDSCGTTIATCKCFRCDGDITRSFCAKCKPKSGRKRA